MPLSMSEKTRTRLLELTLIMSAGVPDAPLSIVQLPLYLFKNYHAEYGTRKTCPVLSAEGLTGTASQKVADCRPLQDGVKASSLIQLL
jgi:hypothetical protein